MVKKCEMCGLEFGDLYKYCFECSKNVRKIQQCQAIKENNFLCNNRARKDQLFCVFHEDYCLHCRRGVVVIGTRCKDCFTGYILDYTFK